MEDSLILKLALGIEISDNDIRSELQEICEREHSSCNSDCPVYFINGNTVPNHIKDNRDGCDCFKDGHKMLEFIRIFK